jgi:hypothetical protein
VQEITVDGDVVFSAGPSNWTATLTTGGSTGATGPSLSQARSGLTITTDAADFNESAYTSNTSLFDNSSGIQEIALPADGNYQITTIGASGGGANNGRDGGKGARMIGEFTENKDTILRCVVGQSGERGSQGGGGGGGTFVVRTDDSALIIAGGGGGADSKGNGEGQDANTGSAGDDGGDDETDPGTGGSGGNNGNGGDGTTLNDGSSGGGGLLTDGQDGNSNLGGEAFVNGAEGGASAYNGGFGGGGGVSNSGGGAGGGGFSGGGGCVDGSSLSGGGGGGGGSINNGTNQSNSSGIGFGDGEIIIELL